MKMTNVKMTERPLSARIAAAAAALLLLLSSAACAAQKPAEVPPESTGYRDGVIGGGKSFSERGEAECAPSDEYYSAVGRSDDLAGIPDSFSGYGYDHDPSMMLCKDGVIIFGTKNGLMHGVAGKDMTWHGEKVPAGTILWKHKIGNCVVNTICPVSGTECLITSSDGNVIRLKAD